MPKPMYVWTGTAWVSVASEVESLATYATQSYADNQPGMKLIIPSSISVGSGSGSVGTQGTVTFSGASSISLNDVFSTVYDNYKIIFHHTKSTNGQTAIRLRVSGADDSSSNYGNQWIYVSNTTLAQYQVNTTSFQLTSSSTASQATILDVINPFSNSQNTLIMGQTLTGIYATQPEVSSNWGRFNANTSFTGFTMIPNAGNITGTVSIYGYKKG